MLRATLKSLLSRKLRLFLSGTAVVLGVMFVSGALVLTDTLGRSFDGLFTTIYQYTQIQVTKTADVTGFNGQPAGAVLPAADVARVKGVTGVSEATGQIFTDGARVVGKNNKTVLGSGGPRFGAGWVGENELIHVRSGNPPRNDDEIAISANLAKTTGYVVGDQVGVLTPFEPKKRMFTVSGILEYSGGRDSLAGETTVFFTQPVAQQLMLGKSDVFNVIDVKVGSGQDLNQVRDRIATALGSGYEVKTGDQLASDSSQSTKQALKFFSYLLLGFAGVALFVGIFLIFNTFSIIVAQRTRELALFRAMGSSRGQVVGSVLIEAVVIGLIASVIGLGLGIGVGALLGNVMGSALSGGALKLAGLGLPPAAIIASFAVGIGITVIAALFPAVRASRIPPVAAMRDAATADRSLTRITVGGVVVLATGGTVLGLGLADKLGGATLWAVLGGLLTCFLGVALFTPIVSRPVVAALGRVMSWNPSGKLGRANSARNPRRTAITAAALMVTIGLVTGISVIFSSIRVSTVNAVHNDLHADLIIATDSLGGIGYFDPKALDNVRQLSDVDSAVGFYGDLVRIDGQPELAQSADNLPTAVTMLDLTPTAGTLAPLASGSVIVDDTTATDRHLSVGSTLKVAMAHAPERTYTVQGIYKRTGTNNGIFFPYEDVIAGFSTPAPIQGFIKVKPGSNVDTVLSQVNNQLADSPEVSAAKVDTFLARQVQIFDFILVFIQILLGLAMIIAVLGIINTLALSMFERTRELGLLRAVGMKRGQVMWMVTVESVVISVFGALLGIAVGVGLGVAVFQTFRDQGFTDLAFPWPLMAAYVFASIGVGLVAGFVPALRASRLDVLKAIAYE
jgi:putative ABC transport system permease protein